MGVTELDGITIGQIAVAVALLAGLITGGGVIAKAVGKAFKKALKSELAPLETKVDALTKRVEAVDMQATKNFLVSFLSDLENGTPQTEIALERFWEEYQHYTRSGGNSYIARKVEQLKTEGKL